MQSLNIQMICKLKKKRRRTRQSKGACNESLDIPEIINGCKNLQVFTLWRKKLHIKYYQRFIERAGGRVENAEGSDFSEETGVSDGGQGSVGILLEGVGVCDFYFLESVDLD